MKVCPLVSVLIPNYNYGNYLGYCLESLLSQTYNNFEVLFSDNRSTDNSFEIAEEYRKKFMSRGIFFSLHQNKVNLGSDRNSKLCFRDVSGELVYTLASDDAIKPTFIEECVKLFEQYPNVVSVMTHREEIDEKGNITEIPPFYNCSCIIPGEEQAAVHMMAGIAIPGQRMVRRRVATDMGQYNRTFQVAGDWFDNFLYCMFGDIAYIDKALCQYRVHSGNETNESELKLMGIFEHYQLLNAFVDISKSFGMTLPAARYEEAVHKLADMCLRYATKMIVMNRFDVADKYLSLSCVFNPNKRAEEGYQRLVSYLSMGAGEQKGEIEFLKEAVNFERKKSYDPPQGAIKF